MPVPQNSDEVDSYFDAAASFLAQAADDQNGRNLEKRQLFAMIGHGYATLAQTGVLWLRSASQDG